MISGKATFIRLSAPSAWASYLINGDTSGTSPEDIAAADAWIKRMGFGAPVDCEDDGFHWQHDAMVECPLGADCEGYTFRLPSVEERRLAKQQAPTVRLTSPD